MEFGLFIQGYTPNFRREVDPEAEHHAFMDDLEVVMAADKAGFKYVWVTEHHFLDEYSHLSANDVVLGYLAHATERIHLGSGIFNPLPQVNHPAKVAERVAMLDHLSERPLRVRHRPGRRQPRDPRLPARHEGPDAGPGRSGRTSSASSPRCGCRTRTRATTASSGRCRPARSCPSRTASPTRPCGTPPATPRATPWRPSKGLGVLGFSVGVVRRAGPGAARPTRTTIGNAEPGRRLRQRQRDGHHRRRSWPRTRRRPRQSLPAART